MTIDSSRCDFCGLQLTNPERAKRVMGDDDPTIWCLNCAAGGTFIFRFTSDAELFSGIEERQEWIDARGGIKTIYDETSPYQPGVMAAQQYINAAKNELSRRGRYKDPDLDECPF